MKKLVPLIILSLLLLVTVVSCGKKKSPEPSFTPTPTAPAATATAPAVNLPKELRLAGPDPVTLDPHLVTDAGSHVYVGKIFSGLLKMDLMAVDRNNDGDFVDDGEPLGNWTKADVQRAVKEDLPAGRAMIYPVMARGKPIKELIVLVPDLAKEIPQPAYNSDGTVSYTFKLREDIRFRNGREVTAWDVAYSLDRVADPKTWSTTAELYLSEILGVWEMVYGREYQGRKLINRVYQYAPGESMDISKVVVDLPGVEVLDKKTLRITTKPVLPILFYYHLTYPAAFVVDKFQVEAAPRSWTDNPNGTGPYFLEKKTVGELVLRVNQNHHGLKPKLDRVVFDISGGSTISSYENDELHLSGISLTDVQAARDSKSKLAGEFFEATEMSTSYLGLNTKEPPFDDPKVRQAFAMAIDRQLLARDVMADMVMPATGVLPPGMPGYRPDLVALSFNPEKARQLLAESKYGGPKGLPRVKLTIAGEGSAPSVVLQAIVEMWRTNLGVEVAIDSIDYVTFLEQIKKGQFQMFSLGWVADYPDPEDFIDLKFYSQRSRANNETGYTNPRVDALIEQARSEKDPQKRIRLYQEAEDIIIQDVPWLLLFYSKNSLLVKPYIKDYFPMTMGISAIQYMYFEEKK